MRLVGSSQPGAVERDRAEALLNQRLVLTDAVCRALAATERQDFLDRRAGEALGLLRGWVAARYERDVETHPRDGLAGMMVPPGCEDLMTELRAGTEVCEAYAMLRTADNDSELRQDAARVRQELGAWEQVRRRLAGDPIDDHDHDDFPSYAVHAPVRTMLVRPGGAVGHRASYDLPGPVHVIASPSPTGAILGSTDADTDRLADELRQRGHELWWAFDPDEPRHESLFVRGLTDDVAREIGREFRQHTVTRWDRRAWHELSCDEPKESVLGWRFAPFRLTGVRGDCLALDIVRPDNLVESHLVVGAPGRWTVCSRSGRGDARGPQVQHVDAGSLLDALATDPILVTLHRREFRRYELSGGVDAAELIDQLVVVPTEGSENPADWPTRFPADHAIDPTPRFDQPWIERWVTVNGRRVSALYADGHTAVVARDSDPGQLSDTLEDLRRRPSR